MQTHQAKRVAIIIEAPMERRLTNALDEAGVTGYSILPVIGGNGTSGRWSAEGQVGRAGGMRQVICVIRPEILEQLLDGAFKVLERHIGIITVSDVEVIRADRF
ncbi:MAG: transcriptional regulator [Pseudomonadota bacterium]